MKPVLVRLLALLAVCSFLNAAVLAQKNSADVRAKEPPPTEYVERALAEMKRISYLRGTADWDEIAAAVRGKAQEAKTLAEAHEVLRLAIRLLGDKHAFLLVPGKNTAGSADGADAGGWVIASRSGDLRSAVLEGDIGYLLVPSFGGPESLTAAGQRRFALRIREEIRKTSPRVKRGWIIDLRFNSGGNMWPMLAGLQPFLPAGELGYFEAGKGRRVAWLSAWGIVGTSTNRALDLSDQPPIPEPAGKKLVVLLGKYTLSSGEAVAVALRSVPGAVQIGRPTGGATTATQPVRLGDGALLFLTTAIYVGRDGTRYGGRIMPDEIIAGGPDYARDLDLENDPVVRAAVGKISEPRR